MVSKHPSAPLMRAAESGDSALQEGTRAPQFGSGRCVENRRGDRGGHMADGMFESVVKAPAAVSGKRAYSVPLSIAVHTGLVITLLILPILAPGVLPTPPAVLAFIAGPSSPLPPPPPAPRTSDPRVQSTRNSNPDAAPVDAPSTVSPERASAHPGDAFSVGAVDGIPGVASAGLIVVSVPPPSPPQTTPRPSAPVRPGGDIRPPTKVKDVRPFYPEIARAAKVEGLVIVEATIGPDGKIQNARVLRSNPLLEQSALDAVRQWEFTPTLLNGVPVPIIMTVTVDFRLR
jgi:protein TonB